MRDRQGLLRQPNTTGLANGIRTRMGVVHQQGPNSNSLTMHSKLGEAIEKLLDRGHTDALAVEKLLRQIRSALHVAIPNCFACSQVCSMRKLSGQR